MADYWLQNKPALVNAFRSIKQTAATTIANRAPISRNLETGDPQIVIYPSYSYLENVADFPYCVTVRGWVFAEGDPNRRRNKLLLATTERFIGGQNPTSPENFREQLIELEQEPETTEPELGELGGSAMVRKRLAPFFRKSLPLGAVRIEITSAEGETNTFNVESDAGGRFEHSLHLAFVPKTITAHHLSASHSISPQFIGPEGVSVISDVDDTVRLTGILAGKRDTLRNVLATPYNKVKLEGVSSWYQHMQHRGAAFHYVSNSPWQMFDSVAGFLTSQGFPPGSMHLKRYQGVIDGIFEPVANRKTKSLSRIFRDFPGRKFILIGDGGELDLETYVQTAQTFPGQVLAIYIRDLILPKEDPLEIADPLVTREAPPDVDLIDLGPPKLPQRPELPPRLNQTQSDKPERPPKSTKPGNRNARSFDQAQISLHHSPTGKPAQPHKHINWAKAEAEFTQPTPGGVAGALFGASSKRGAVVEAANIVRDQIKGKKAQPDFVSSSQDYSDYERIDKERRRIDNWKARIIEAKRSLPKGVELKMWRTPADVESGSLNKISSGPDLL